MQKQKARYEPMRRLKVKRIEKGITQTELGILVGIGQNSVSNYERGENFPRYSVLERLAAALECEIKDIV